jgi:hypothetical protein
VIYWLDILWRTFKYTKQNSFWNLIHLNKFVRHISAYTEYVSLLCITQQKIIHFMKSFQCDVAPSNNIISIWRPTSCFLIQSISDWKLQCEPKRMSVLYGACSNAIVTYLKADRRLFRSILRSTKVKSKFIKFLKTVYCERTVVADTLLIHNSCSRYIINI